MQTLDYAVILAIGLLSMLFGALIAYVIAKRTLTVEFFMDNIDTFLSEIQTNKDIQQKIYMVGAILGQGVKGGIGLQTPKGQRFRFEDIIGIAIQQFLPNILGQQGQNAETQGQTQSTQVNTKIGL